MTVRGGYVFDNKRDERLLNKFSLGMSFRLDDYINTSRHAQKGSRIFKNAALRLDGGFLNSKTFSNVYQGSMTYRPVGPEPFEFVKNDFMSYDVKTRPDSSYQVLCDTIPLTWKATNDPDLYDQVNYLMFITKDDSTALDQYIQMAKRNDHDLHGYLKDDKASPNPIDATEIRILHVPPKSNQMTTGTNGSASQKIVIGSKFFAHSNERQLNYDLSIPCDAPGDYYWTVVAYDINRHFSVINADEGHIARFYVKPAPQFTIEIKKHPNQGRVDVKITNVDSFDIDRDFLLRISFLDSTQSKSIVYKAKEEARGELTDKDFYQISDIRTQGKTIIDWGVYSPADSPLERKIIPALPAGDSVKFQVKVNSTSPYVIAEIDSANVCCANVRDTLALSDPQLKKTAVVATFQPRVIFRKVGSFTLTRLVRSELQRLAKAFKSPLLKDVCIKINGHTDEQGWHGRTNAESMKLNEELSLKRVASVRDYLDSLGVDTTRIILQGYGQSKPRIPKVDSTFVYLQKTRREPLHRTNRRVEIYLIRTNCAHNVCSITDLNNCAVDTLKTVNPGDQITYVFKVKNDSQFAARNVEIRDLLPEHVYPVSNRYLTNGNRYLFSETIALIPPGTTKTIEFFATVNDSLPSALFKLASTATLHSPNDLDLSNNTSSDSIYVIGGQHPNLEPIATKVMITGTPRVGKILTASYLYYDSDGDLQGSSTYRWLRNGSSIRNATSKRYRLQNADTGSLISFEVTPQAQKGTSPGGAATSSRLGPIMPDRSPIVNSAEIIGTPAVDSLLHADYVVSDPDGDKIGDPHIQWLRGGKPITGATLATYEVRLADVGAEIAVEVTPVSQNGASSGTPFRSAAVGPIPSVIRLQKPEIKGFPQVGYVLEATVIYAKIPGLELKYEWLRSKKEDGDFERVSKQTSKNYELFEGDKGSYLKCKVTAIINGKVGIVKSSKSFGPIDPPSGVKIFE